LSVCIVCIKECKAEATVNNGSHNVVLSGKHYYCSTAG